MADWIKYDGTNKPDDDALVRIRHDEEVDADGEAWESTGYQHPNYWLGWSIEDDNDRPLISHFQLNDKEND